MIIIRVQAGFGNQISQYAFSRFLYLNGLCKDIKLDFSYFIENDDVQCYFENAFYKDKLVYFKAEENDLKQVTGMSGIGRKRTLIERTKNFTMRYIQKVRGISPFIVQNVEDGYDDDFSMIDWNRDLYFNGTWHNIDYSGCLAQLKKELVFNTNAETLLDDTWKEYFDTDNTIAIHVRMGDYMRPGDEHNILIDSKYYPNAIEVMKKKYNKVKFVIFSDDRQEAFDIIRPMVTESEIRVFSQDVKDWEEMYLMTLCKGVICANSTFSYWGALLGYDSQKTILFPEYYAKGRKSWNNSCIELIPLS